MLAGGITTIRDLGDRNYVSLTLRDWFRSGAEVGPEITVNGRASFDQLLSNVFDPSLVIGVAAWAADVDPEMRRYWPFPNSGADGPLDVEGALLMVDAWAVVGGKREVLDGVRRHNTFPGLRMPFGSSVRFNVFIKSYATGSLIFGR